MPVQAPQSLKLGIVEPRDALARFQSRELLLPTFRWQDAWQQEHARGFAVAGVMKLDVLQQFYDELQTSLASGGSLEAFRASMRSRLVKAGMWGDVKIKDPATGEERVTRFDDRRLRTVFDVNMRQSQAAGRWDRIERTKAVKPFVMYRTMQDERVRASHAAWNGTVLPVDHAFWKTHYPPCGWRCRCTAFAVDERDIERRRARGETIKTEAPPEQWVQYVNPHTGEVALVPQGIDPGFAHNPGQEELSGLLPQALRDSGLNVASYVSARDTSPLPAARPQPASLLMPKGLDESAYVDAFMTAFGARRDEANRWIARTFTDAAGEDLVLSPAMFIDRVSGHAKTLKRGREEFVRVLAEAIKSPDEIWLTPMLTREGRAVVRRRYLARFKIRGKAQPLLGVFEWGKDGWAAITGYAADEEEHLLNQRRGFLAYRRQP